MGWAPLMGSAMGFEACSGEPRQKEQAVFHSSQCVLQWRAPDASIFEVKRNHQWPNMPQEVPERPALASVEEYRVAGSRQLAPQAHDSRPAFRHRAAAG